MSTKSPEEPHKPRMTAGRYFLAGLLSIIPLGVTLFILMFLKNLLASIGRGPVDAGLRFIGERWAPESELVVENWMVDALAVIVVIVGIYFLGVMVSNFVGRQLLRVFEAILDRIPVVKSIYGAVKKLVTLINQRPEDGEIQKVVLIDFPSPEMKAIGLVTQTMTDPDTGKQLAAVYVPTTPNPTNGYLEILPLDRLTPTDWTFDQAMSFVVSAGATAPATLRFNRPAAVEAPREDSGLAGS